MASDSDDDGLEELEFEGEDYEDENGLIDAQEDATEDGEEVCMYSGISCLRAQVIYHISGILGILGRRRRG